VNASAAGVRLARAERKIRVSKLAPNTDHFDAFGCVRLDKKIVFQRRPSLLTGIWKLLRPEEIDLQLTDGFMMDPEASVSALVFHDPDCTYFSAGDATQPKEGSL
jgi:Vitamin B12 dependent methionine synthase, activation domain